MTIYVYGKNTVKQLIQNNKKIYEVILSDTLKDKDIEAMLNKQHVTYRKLSRKAMDNMFEQANHQGIVAKIDDYKTYEVKEILANVPEGKLPLLVMLDGIEDPHNLGAILRTCDAIGADGVILGKHRSVHLTPTVAKVSTGAIDTVKVAVVTNLSNTIQDLKKDGFWIVGSDFENSVDYRKGTYDVPLVLVVGAEGTGISKLVKKQCDYCVTLPMVGRVSSLNASVACGILLYQIHEQRN